MPAVQVQKLSGQPLSRKCRRRVNREIHFEEEVNKTIDGLNLMHGAAKQRDYPFPEASAAQYRSLEFIEQAVRQLGFPDGLMAQRPLRRFL